MLRVVTTLAAIAFAAPVAVAAADPPPLTAPPPAPLEAPGTQKDPQPDQYIVELTAPPLARYSGGAKGLAPTAPSVTGRKLDADSPAARAWAQELSDRQSDVLEAAAPGVKPTVSYRTAFAGFAAHLSDAQAQALRAQPGVAHVTRERFLHLDAQATAAGISGSEAELLGLPGGLWKQLGGRAAAGRGVIVGVVDTGVTPESPSFTDHALPAPVSWDGVCQGGQRFPTSTCTNKLIGARYFVDGYGRDNLPEGDFEFLSPRDAVGHGTHVAASAVGDYGVDPLIGGNPLGVDTITGIAPAAYLAVYKSCWIGQCSDVDIVAAMDAAVRDGVDVLNLSFGEQQAPGTMVDPVEQAALNADAAGVFVAAAAGNDGTFPGALGSPAAAPWTTAVAATRGSRTFRSTLHVTGGGGAVDLSASTTWAGFDDVPLFDARTVDPDFDGTWNDDPRFCFNGLT